MKSNPKIVYKYRNWKEPNHKRILFENELYLSSPKDFTDPVDCRINQNFSLLTTKEEDEYITELAIQGFPDAERRGVDYNKVIRDFEERFSNKPEFQRFADTILYSHQDKNYAIFSCSTRWNSILMWSHYAAFHTGICIGFRYQKLFDSQLFGKGGSVIYQTDYPKIKPRPAKKNQQLMIDSFIETHTKAKEWHYEREYRFMRTSPKELTKEERIVHIEDNFFAEVILGISISDNDKIEIIDICKKKGIPVFQAYKKDFQFRIKREKIK